MTRPNIARITASIIVAAIYIAVRVWNLTDSCLWFDEIFSVHAAEHSWDSIQQFVALDLIHPPLFYVLLKLWIAIGSESLLWLRSLPVIWSIIAVMPFLLLCRELQLNHWTTTFAFLLIAVNGSLIKYSQEVRMYSLLMCVSLFSIWLFLRFIRTGKGIVALTIINLVLVYTHYFGWMVILSEIASVIVFHQIKWRPILLMLAATALGFLPWLVAVLFAAGSGSELSQNIGWMQRPGIAGITQLILGLVEPFYYSATSIDPFSIYVASVPLFLIAITAICLYFANQKNTDARTAHSMYLLIIFVLTPSITAFVASWTLPYSVWGTRHLIIVFVPFLIVAAISMSKLPGQALRVAALTVVLMLNSYAFVVEVSRIKQPPVWCGFEILAKELQADRHGPVYVFEDLAAYHLWFEFRNYADANFRPRIIKVDDFPGMAEDKAYFTPRGLNDEYLTHGTLPTDSAHMWVVYRAIDFDVTKPPLSTLIKQGFHVARQEIYDGGSTKVIAVFLEKG
jgi:uncharacterized membrane protein